MAQSFDTVVDDVTLRLVVPGDDGVMLRARLRYEPSDPFAVEATFRAGDEAISWVLGRDVLSDGLHDETGVGDVRVWPAALTGGDPAMVMIELRSPDGQAQLAVDSADLDAFLLRTFSAVPQGREGEWLDLDSVVSRLLD